MARTLSGKLTGRAARIELAEWKERNASLGDPNSSLWKERANNELCRLIDSIGDDEARRQTENIEGTWMQIAKSICLIADLAERQVDGTRPSPFVWGGEVFDPNPVAGSEEIPF